MESEMSTFSAIVQHRSLYVHVPLTYWNTRLFIKYMAYFPPILSLLLWGI